ncbi:MAG TPA: prepilin-type N-terminal cleavage/methylation domain-containing protein [Candidatus Saccharibacteria bacterium]|nr:prepilin-type N-terminal cleavage/methylation domain-containing protein [Candidatus Saccharibacteria bacterium]HMR38623.1 prepilin-type N-terminal cleavage/methylation domain-containing protein [Candidatus Saccharibacteria bacterium]
MTKKLHGFTIVELLIVIVVIAILAMISVATYRGIQDRARSAVIQSNLNGAAKQLEIYKAQEGSYPVTQTQLYQGDTGSTPVIKAATWTRSPDPYVWVGYCSNGSEYSLIARQQGNDKWFVLGSSISLKESAVAGTSSATDTCTNLANIPDNAGRYAHWMKSSAGWTAGY